MVTRYWWVRGVLYLGMAAGGYALYATVPCDTEKNGSNCWYTLVPMTGLALAGVLFIVATVRREPGKGDDEAAGSAGKSTAPPAVPPPGVFGGFFSRKVDETATKAATAAGAAAGKSAAQSMFGSKSEDAEVPAPAPAPAGPTPGMFSGGGLFGGSSSGGGGGGSVPAAGATTKASKYGYDATSPEANPFVA